MAERDLAEMDGFIEEGGKRVPFYLKISGPRKSDDGDDYYCEIHAPKLFENAKKIHGVDGSQARKLAVEFVGSLLQERRLFDKDGKFVTLSSAGLSYP